MKNFNWLGFKLGRFMVSCSSRETMKDFLQQCEERGFLWLSGDKPTQNDYFHKNYDIIAFESNDGRLTYKHSYFPGGNVVAWESIQTTQTIQPEPTYTWREVITNIQDGETYKCGDKFICCTEGVIRIGDETDCLRLNNEDLFFKQQETVDFQEALTVLINGGIVRSTLNDKYYLLANGNLKCSGDIGFECWELTDLSGEEILSKWNIIKNNKVND